MPYLAKDVQDSRGPTADPLTGSTGRETQTARGMPAPMALAFILIVALIIAYFSMKSTVIRESSDPRFQPLGVSEIKAGLGRLQNDALPMVALEPANGPPIEQQSRLGGPIWAPDTETTWPEDEYGRPLLHVAQLNFAEFDPPEGFPREGLLQIFVRHDGTGVPLVSTDELSKSETESPLVTRWYDAPSGGRSLSVPDSLREMTKGMLASDQARKEGVALRPVRQTLPANPYAWPYWDEVYLNLTRRRPANDMAAQLQNGLKAHFDTIVNAYGGHWIGGHPSFSGEDMRRTKSALRGLDRVLLHIGFDKHVCIGDAGAINILISRHDLLQRRFDRAYCLSEA
ncbi:MAG: YwqG family protein [Pseudomonadota bacterium]